MFNQKILQDQRKNRIISWQCFSKAEVGLAVPTFLFFISFLTVQTDFMMKVVGNP